MKNAAQVRIKVRGKVKKVILPSFVPGKKTRRPGGGGIESAELESWECPLQIFGGNQYSLWFIIASTNHNR